MESVVDVGGSTELIRVGVATLPPLLCGLLGAIAAITTRKTAWETVGWIVTASFAYFAWWVFVAIWYHIFLA